MTETKPIMNLVEPLTQSGDNGIAFEYASRRFGASIGLRKLGCSIYLVPPGKGACQVTLIVPPRVARALEPVSSQL